MIYIFSKQRGNLAKAIIATFSTSGPRMRKNGKGPGSQGPSPVCVIYTINIL